MQTNTNHNMLFRSLHHLARSTSRRSSTFTNFLASETPPPVQVSTITPDGIHLANGVLLPSACIFLHGNVFLWEVPPKLWDGWTRDQFEIFETVVPRPGMQSYPPLEANLSRPSGRIVVTRDRKERRSRPTRPSFLREWLGHPARRHGHRMSYYLSSTTPRSHPARETHALHTTSSPKKAVSSLPPFFPSPIGPGELDHDCMRMNSE
jgi:hypothetical protein